jgi:hypothetical protein
MDELTNAGDEMLPDESELCLFIITLLCFAPDACLNSVKFDEADFIAFAQRKKKVFRVEYSYKLKKDTSSTPKEAHAQRALRLWSLANVTHTEEFGEIIVFDGSFDDTRVKELQGRHDFVPLSYFCLCPSSYLFEIGRP